MNLVEFIQYHQSTDTLGYIMNGFEQSEFVDNNLRAYELVRAIIDANTHGSSTVLSQVQSGGLGKLLPAQVKKISYCTEFNQMLSNLVGLLGWEFSKALMLHTGIGQIVNAEVELIRTSKNYDEIIKHIKLVRNAYGYPNTVDGQFYEWLNGRKADLATHSLMFSGPPQEIPENSLSYYDAVQTSSVDKVFDDLIRQVMNYRAAKNEIAFNTNCEDWYSIMHMLVSLTRFGTYTIDNIDELLMNYKPIGYEGSFIKAFEVSMKESQADAPYVAQENFHPWLNYCKTLNIRVEDYIAAYQGYFVKIYNDTLDFVAEDPPGLNVEITDELLEQLGNVTCNLLVGLGRYICAAEQISATLGKSVRIQFIHVYEGVANLLPRMFNLTFKQQVVLHYVLLGGKLLNSAIAVVTNVEEPIQEEDLPVPERVTTKDTEVRRRIIRKKSTPSATPNTGSSAGSPDKSRRIIRRTPGPSKPIAELDIPPGQEPVAESLPQTAPTPATTFTTPVTRTPTASSTTPPKPVTSPMNRPINRTINRGKAMSFSRATPPSPSS